MRKQYEQILKQQCHKRLLQRREKLGLTQEEMARLLLMACRTYVDLDHGKTGCSALTLALYLLYICADPADFLEELRNALENRASQVA